MTTADWSRDDIQYRFFRLYAIDLDSVKGSLRLLRRYRRDDVRFCILREIVVSYGRPFSGNKSVDGASHYLSLKFVPEEQRPLHDELMCLRSQLFAHTDLSFHNPRVARWRTARGPLFPMTFVRPPYERLLVLTPEIARLVQAVEAKLQTAIHAMEPVE